MNENSEFVVIYNIHKVGKRLLASLFRRQHNLADYQEGVEQRRSGQPLRITDCGMYKTRPGRVLQRRVELFCGPLIFSDGREGRGRADG